MEELAKHRFVPSDLIAVVYAGLGDKDKAFEWLEKAYRQHYFHILIKIDPKFKTLRSDPRFADLLRRMGVTP